MYANVLVQYGAKSLDHTFTYHIPANLVDKVVVGGKVSVPFGKQNINGFVVGITDECNILDIKDIKGVVTENLRLNDELLKLGKYLSEKTLCTLITAYQTMLPTSLKVSNSKDNYDLIVRYLVLNKSDEEIEEYINNNKRGLKQNELLRRLLNERKILRSEFSYQTVNRLLELSLIKEENESVFRINPSNDLKEEYELNLEQENAYNEIINNINEPNVFLLHGITGSGKTEVYMHLVKSVIKENKTVIMLVPEISLTTQIVKRFYDRFGSDVAIFHSNLSEGEKYDEYNKINSGKVHIVVGTRSSIFTPVKNLGLIIIDEEHSQNYKQETNPRYHAIDIAKWRSEYNKCPIVLGSATPSYESMARALKGVYKYLPLTKRIGKSHLPDIKIVDMSLEYKKRNMILSDELQLEIMNTLDKNEQVMLLINRRGYSTIITCASCGYTYKCPHCDITLTYHKSKDHFRCHYCGYTVMNSSICPNCKEDAIRDFGMGTEKVYEYVKELYPSKRVVRMDTDTTSKKGSHEKIIKQIENHEYDIIIGTQMISKGFDFPKVTLVGVINADESLNIPDFRSGENTFSLLSQVSGRAGRAEFPGKVILQSFNPDNKTLNYVLNQDYMGNYKYEMNIRRTLKYPPYYFLIGVKITSKDYELASKEATKSINYIKKHVNKETKVLGPTTAQLFKVNNIYRFQIIIKYRFDESVMEVLKFLDKEYSLRKDVNIEIDVDPIRM